MKVSKQIRKINGEKPDWIMDDIQDIGYWNGMETAAQIAEDLEKETQLNENQQIVLEWLKSIGKEMPIYRMADQMKWYIDYASTGKELSHALAALSEKEEFQVLAAFAEWGMKEVAE